MWLVTGCWLLVAGGTNLLVVKELKLTLMWLVAGYWLLVTGYWLLVTGCWLHEFACC